ncbi:MAG: protein phosphatase CheZ [Nitrosomonadales bacterium]|nr:protein phosphatase CheZ [Nitrosomonadales bacterium]
MTNKADATQDSEELEALFDSIVAAGNEPVAPAGGAGNAADKVINRVGHMTRSLHDALRELGYDKNLEKATATIPDARDRLNYVATLTEKAAERVLNATDAAQPVVEKIEIESQRLSGEWQKLFDRQLDVEQFKSLAVQTQAFLAEVPKQARATNAYLMEIMMAQDFQDLTGQVIKKIVEVTRQMEKELVELLVENPPSTANPDAYAGLLNGPVVNATGRSDVVTSQDQVDELLESLGF